MARARLLEHHDSKLSLVDMFSYPSARALAEAIDRKPAEGPDEAVSAGAARAAARRVAGQAAARRAGRTGA
ncbi:hypothetical protein ACFQ3Z_09155 [Streptomyces nogalater]